MLRLIETHDLVLFFNPQTDCLVQDKDYYESNDKCIGTGSADSDQLGYELFHVAGQQPVGADSSKDTGKDCSGCAADTMNTEGIK